MPKQGEAPEGNVIRKELTLLIEKMELLNMEIHKL